MHCGTFCACPINHRAVLVWGKNVLLGQPSCCLWWILMGRLDTCNQAHQALGEQSPALQHGAALPGWGGAGPELLSSEEEGTSEIKSCSSWRSRSAGELHGPHRTILKEL